jgi:hypothetical protein
MDLICSANYPGDNNETLKTIQRRLFGELMVYLPQLAAERYFRALSLVRLNSPLADRFRNRPHWPQYDLIGLRAAYETIAGHYRRTYDRGGQMPLPFDRMPYSQYLEIKWCQYWFPEIQRLVENDDITYAVLVATAYGMEREGCDAQEDLKSLLDMRYREIRWALLEASAEAAQENA